MKIECSCGAKYQFELRPEMKDQPVSFVCPACGVDSSAFVSSLVRRELGQSNAPEGAPSAPPLQHSNTPSPEPGDVLAVQAPPCSKHPGELAAQKCYVCGRAICPKCMELFGYVCSPLCKAKAGSHGINLPVYEFQKSVVEARRWRKVLWASSSAAALMFLLLGIWIWYAWFGCAPKTIFSVRFDEPSYSGQSALAGQNHDQLVFLHGATLARYDLKSRAKVWSRELLDRQQIQRAVDRHIQANKAILDKAHSEAWQQIPKMPSPDEVAQATERAAAASLVLHARRQNLWIESPGKLLQCDWETGKTIKELPVPESLGGVISRGNELLVVDAHSGNPTATHISLLTGEIKEEGLQGTVSQGVGGSLNTVNKRAGEEFGGMPSASAGNRAKPMDPAKVEAQAQRLSLPEKIALPAVLAGNLNQQHALKELDESGEQPVTTSGAEPQTSGVSLIPTKDGFVAFSVRLLEARIVTRSAMKPGTGKSVLDGDVTAGKSMELATEMLNEAQRSNGGDVVQEDHSRYQVTLRRPGSDNFWTGEVVGPPRLYPLDSVNVLAADKVIIVFDKANKKLWQSTLSFNVKPGLATLDEESSTYGMGPCVERKGSLYVFDEGVLSAFDIINGSARWRLPSVGIVGLFFDDHDMIYVNSTTATHDRLKYSRQVDLSRKISSVILKIDSRNGKILWSEESKGLVNYVSGKFILAAQSSIPDTPDDSDTGFEKRPWLRIRRINASNGREVWDHFQERAPLDIAFDENMIRLVFKKEVQVLRFPGF
jgi:hypothetical protein